MAAEPDSQLLFQFLNFVCQGEFQWPGGGLLLIESLFQAGFDGSSPP